MTIIKQEGRRIMDAEPSETAVGNMVRRGMSFSHLQICSGHIHDCVTTYQCREQRDTVAKKSARLNEGTKGQGFGLDVTLAFLQECARKLLLLLKTKRYTSQFLMRSALRNVNKP